MTGEFPLRVGVALGAGSAAAMAEIGALEALTNAGIPVHCVAGTSAGAIVGAAFAGGRLAALRECLAGLSSHGVMRLFDPRWPREGLLRGLRALEFIRPHLGERIEDLTLRYAALATDLRRGDEVLLTRGPVLDAVRASIAVPGLFTPWRVAGRLLVDGGLLNPVPVTAARALGAEVVIALNVLPLRDDARPVIQLLPEALPAAQASENAADQERLGLSDVLWRASRILSSQVASSRLRDDPPAYLMQIPVPEIGMFELHRTNELADVGRRCAEKALPEIRDALERALPLRNRIAEWPRRVRARWVDSGFAPLASENS